MRQRANVDANQAEIVAAIRACGGTVQHLHQVGRGCPDLLVGHRGRNLLVEVKDGSKPPSKRRLTADEQAWHDSWNGHVSIVESIDDAIELLNESA